MQEAQDQEQVSQPVDNVDYVVWQAVLYLGEGRLKVINQKDFFNDDLPPEDRPSYEQIDRTKLRMFRMINPVNDRVVLQIPFREGQGGRLVWRRRRQWQDGAETWYYVVGKKGGFMSVILPDFSIIMDDKFSEDNALLSDIEPVAGEEGYIGDQ